MKNTQSSPTQKAYHIKEHDLFLHKCKGLVSSKTLFISAAVLVTFIKYVFTCLKSAEVLKFISLTLFQMFDAKVVAVKKLKTEKKTPTNCRWIYKYRA